MISEELTKIIEAQYLGKPIPDYTDILSARKKINELRGENNA